MRVADHVSNIIFCMRTVWTNDCSIALPVIVIAQLPQPFAMIGAYQVAQSAQHAASQYWPETDHPQSIKLKDVYCAGRASTARTWQSRSGLVAPPRSGPSSSTQMRTSASRSWPTCSVVSPYPKSMIASQLCLRHHDPSGRRSSGAILLS